MSEVPDCPYCGAEVHTDRVIDYDSKIKLRCKNCGGIFEFMPGFGAFSLPEHEQRSSIRHEESVPGYHHEIYEADAAGGTERPPAQGRNCGAACIILCCLCCFLPVIMLVMMIIFGFGLFWF